MMRTSNDIRRGASVSIEVDGERVDAHGGETVATAMLAAGRARIRDDLSNSPRGLWCNMGTCSECFLERIDTDPVRRLRTCLTPVEDGMRLRSGIAAIDV